MSQTSMDPAKTKAQGRTVRQGTQSQGTTSKPTQQTKAPNNNPSNSKSKTSYSSINGVAPRHGGVGLQTASKLPVNPSPSKLTTTRTSAIDRRNNYRSTPTTVRLNKYNRSSTSHNMENGTAHNPRPSPGPNASGSQTHSTPNR